MSEKVEKNAPKDRREYFRMDADVHLVLRVLSEDDYLRALEVPELESPDLCGLAGQLHGLSSQAGLILSHIRKSDPEIAQYLSLMDKKLDLVARMAEGSRYEDLAPNAHVNISATGLAFAHAEALAEDTKLQVKMLFFPSYLCVRALGRVVRCESENTAREERPYRIGMQFTRIREAEQDALVKHMLELQSASLRRQRGY